MGASLQDAGAVLAGLSVLVVDADYRTRKLLRSLLVALGCTRVHDARDGAGGLATIRSIRPDIVLLAWNLPDLDGGAFVRAMRAPDAGAFAGMEVVVLTRAGESTGVLEAVRLGLHEFLLKPVSREALQARLVSVLARMRLSVRQDRLRRTPAGA
jgi:two-component system, chemotaxis family, chemotaxis protein CheY